MMEDSETDIESSNDYVPSELDDSDENAVSDGHGSNFPNTSGTQEDIQHNPHRCKKRKKHESKAEFRKRARNAGIAYTSSRNKKVDKKKFENVDCRCRKKCVQKISEASRKHLFQMFWKMGSFSRQNAYICGLVQQTVPKARRPKDSSRVHKSTSNYYRFQVDEKSVNVCKPYFLKTLQISDGRLTRALKKMRMGEQPGCDNRGRHIPGNKVPEERLKLVRDHISSFPSYQSHYTRTENPNRRFLPSHLNVRLMYNLYKEHCQSINMMPVDEHIYRRTFNNNFNLHFHSPSKDTCAKCDAYKIKISASDNEQENSQLKIEHELHLRKAEAARESLKRDKEKAKQDETFYAFTFDLEKALPFPVLTTSVAYYKRNMYVYNLGCHEMSNDIGFMYVWDETVASRGSQEIGSCVTKHIQTRASMTKHVVMYSDTCTGQNRNLKFVLFLMKLVASNNNSIEVIDHKFMVSGHSFLPNDSDFGSVETYARKKLMYVPEDWYNAIKACRRNKAFDVTEMSRDDFKSIANLEKIITRRKKNENNQPVSWFNMQWIRVVREEPYKLYYKETLMEESPFSVLNLKSSKIGRPPSFGRVFLRNLYQRPRLVTQKKKQDMLDLLKFIPPIYHEFFQNLSTGGTEEEDVGPLDIVEIENFDKIEIQ